ncbi:hypothetical protein [Lysinibacter cavernae]|uniref:Peptidase metallopeptidase domain-containing protein n=1 Tax=Lysinibacter cavernae TaxID=1640652 RepID=A0A7X5TVG3_9MICO|nr:hypothetical protein [Lysinibacter cavernae]NIH55117.1 hypothetical protein [Lysinibacter cavernae]
MEHLQIHKQLVVCLSTLLVLGLSSSGLSPSFAETMTDESGSPPSVESEPPDVEPPQPSATDSSEEVQGQTETAPPESPSDGTTDLPAEGPPVLPTPAVPTTPPTSEPPSEDSEVDEFPAQVDSGGLVEGPEGGLSAFPGTAAVVGNGFAISGSIRYNNGNYVLRLIDSPGIGILRASVIEAINNINQTGAVTITLAAGTIPAKPAIDVRGELYLEVSAVSPCSAPWAGCGVAKTAREDNLTKAISGRAWVHPLVFDYGPNIRKHVIIHELGHALGLSHFDSQYAGQWQLMNKGRYDSLVLASGDIAGLNYLKHPRPTGNFDSLADTGSSFSVSGWAMDGIHNNAVSVHIYVNGVMKATLPASTSRPDVNRVYGRGANHGFASKLTQAPGRYTVCAYAKHNTTPLSTPIGCKAVVVSNANKTPIGNVEGARGGVETATVSGWALDQNTKASISVHVYVDGRYAGASLAKSSRPDVDRAYKMGAAHGFTVTVKAPAGSRSVCVYAINTPAGQNPLLSCRKVTVLINRVPIGNIESVTTQSRAVAVRGWTLDPDTTASLSVHVYIDGRFSRAISANGNRPDVNRVHTMGALHGYSATIALSPGQHQVCLYAINSPSGTNPLLGCAIRMVPK